MNDEMPEHPPRTYRRATQTLSAEQALALDFALGILVEPLREQAARRCVLDTDFAALVAMYRRMIDAGDVESTDDQADDSPLAPSAESWAKIQRRLTDREPS